MPWSTQQTLNPARKVAGVEVFSAYHGTHRGSPNTFLPGIIPFLSFALHFDQLLPLPEMHPRVSLALERPQNSSTPSQLGCDTVCCPLLPQTPSSISLVLQNPSHSPELGMNIKLITKQFLLLIENSLQGVNSRRKKGLL